VKVQSLLFDKRDNVPRICSITALRETSCPNRMRSAFLWPRHPKKLLSADSLWRASVWEQTAQGNFELDQHQWAESSLLNYTVKLLFPFYLTKAYHGLSSWSLASHLGGLSSHPGYSMRKLWWTKWHWAGISPSSCVFLRLVIIAPYSCIRPHVVRDSSDQAAYHHNLDNKLGALLISRHLVGLGVKY
jgi:hypothetical protein